MFENIFNLIRVFISNADTFNMNEWEPKDYSLIVEVNWDHQMEKNIFGYIIDDEKIGNGKIILEDGIINEIQVKKVN